MKFDMGQAWSQAVAMLSANRDLVLVVAGVFFFLPSVVSAMIMPTFVQEFPVAQPDTDPTIVLQTMGNAMIEVFRRTWWIYAIMILLQYLGSLTLLALLRDSSRPTLGEALKLGATAFLPMLAAQLILSVGIGIALVVIGGLAFTANIGLGVLVSLLLFVVLAYLWVKFSLIPPVIAVERVYNPVAAIVRSWRLTKGNSFRLFFFYVLIVIIAVVIVLVVSGIFGLVFAALGPQVQLLGNAIVSGAFQAAVGALMLGIYAAAHRQLAGPSDGNLSEVFE